MICRSLHEFERDAVKKDLSCHDHSSPYAKRLPMAYFLLPDSDCLRLPWSDA